MLKHSQRQSRSHATTATEVHMLATSTKAGGSDTLEPRILRFRSAMQLSQGTKPAAPAPTTASNRGLQNAPMASLGPGMAAEARGLQGQHYVPE